MNRSMLWLAGLALLACVLPTARGECPGRTLGDDLQCTRASILPFWCCDDYCPKPAPCITCLAPSCCPDTYCRKPIPCIVCGPCGGGCDNYCRKPLPCFCWPVAPCGTRCP